LAGLKADQPVRHAVHGEGRVVAALGETAVVRFGEDIQQVEVASLEAIRSLEDALSSGVPDDSLEVLTRAQALLIRSINDQWGVFARSRLKLLPHQLWVCHMVTREWPARWLVADDVGLGKTVEAGLILTPLMASGRIRRLLILAPARLVPQWRARLKHMFDIRLQEYTSEQDRGTISFWDTASQVVASFHTLRQHKARERLLQAEPWDMVMVDEAHHFQAQKEQMTLTHTLLRDLQEKGLMESLVLFTGTPHRGKDDAFLSLMKLLRPDLFDPDRSLREQLHHLPEVMIRNNKALVTDLEGNRLFKPVHTETIDYSYSPEEETFYKTMSAFIADGRAYASSLAGREQSARMLLLIALQKLAASSIAAIRHALERRRDVLASLTRAVREVVTTDGEQTAETLDDKAEEEERRPADVALKLMQDELERLDELIELAGCITRETKMDRLIELMESRLPEEEPVLLFTEYKATQAMVVAALEERFGKGCAGFINGDERLRITTADGQVEVRHLRRDTAAADFNHGRTRFLVSTEAGGEGIDLQERCATLIHVDLPWNPMRLHQRVGRLNRYGQKRSVQVFLLRNPSTVEARIWELLEQKLARIQSALSASMDEAEDIAQLVIGMQGGQFFDEIFSDALEVVRNRSGSRLDEWFDARTGTFGGQDAVEMVRAMLGNVARYDFGTVREDLPKVDLPDLRPFFLNVMRLMGRRVKHDNAEGLGVKTPEDWKDDLTLKERYTGLVFDRNLPEGERMTRLLGIGHALLDRAISEAMSRQALTGRVKDLLSPLVLVAVEDEITGTSATIHRIVLPLQGNADASRMADWQALRLLNATTPVAAGDQAPLREQEANMIHEIIRKRDLSEKIADLKLPFRRPKVTPLIALLPAE